jgi:hypothetical protein
MANSNRLDKDQMLILGQKRFAVHRGFAQHEAIVHVVPSQAARPAVLSAHKPGGHTTATGVLH